MEKKYFEIPFEIKAITEEDPDFFTFEGYGSTKDLDLGKDIVEPTAFNGYLKTRTPVLLWQHDRHEPIGIFDSLTPDSKGLFVKARMPKSDTFVSGRVIPQLRIGSVKSLSIGYVPKKAEWDKETSIRTIKEADLPEISLVTFPMNINAVITGMKSINERGKLPKMFAEKSYRWNETEAEKRVKAWAKAEENLNTEYKNAFLWLDPENSDTFTRYKFLITDIIDGKAVIVPRALFAVRGVLSGARGGINIPAEDQAKMKGIINTLYDELGLEAPFTKEGTPLPWCITELTCLQKSAIAWGLRDLAVSRDAANYIAGLILADADQKNLADAGEKAAILQELKRLNNIIKKG